MRYWIRTRPRFLNVQMVISWWLQLMGNRIISCAQLQPEPPVETENIKVIKSDGLVKIYDRPIHVSEVMAQFPRHLLCRSDCFYIGQKIQALSESDQLQPGRKYFLLPSHCFQSVLSFVTIASILQRSSSSSKINNAFVKKVATCQPFDIQKSSSGSTRIRVCDEFISQLLEEGKHMVTDRPEDNNSYSTAAGRAPLCTTPQLHKDYSQLVMGSRQWKPKLETIKETEKRKLPSSFGMKRIRKRSHHQSELYISRVSVLSDRLQADHFQASSPSSKSKTRVRSRK